ncbi:uncharacterized protein Tco025E_04294 [Trypanosoma conorhini]|uniref:Uncharacterized protein n=1 Tax=Trypanosoma conorhini TaxID=83891 RepID=A0A3R7NAJ3_9TRYP|nr:uncharacterized protein Tco025E_04294 [Trypanosoma conorhini]RNF19104.1 hypothetical protein Tco025E_04294 [Trypanosoma conorhini]
MYGSAGHSLVHAGGVTVALAKARYGPGLVSDVGIWRRASAAAAGVGGVAAALRWLLLLLMMMMAATCEKRGGVTAFKPKNANSRDNWTKRGKDAFTCYYYCLCFSPVMHAGARCGGRPVVREAQRELRSPRHGSDTLSGTGGRGARQKADGNA